jgi:hypothetical protein
MRAKYRKNMSIKDKLSERFTIKQDGCWEWLAGKDKNGYGRIWHNNQNSTAHTVAYSIFVGPIPDGLHIRHSCDNPSCINPDHLELGSHADNMKDKSIRERVHGEKNPNAKYTDEVRAMAKQWTGTLKEFTSLTGMSGPYLSTLRKNMSKFA